MIEVPKPHLFSCALRRLDRRVTRGVVDDEDLGEEIAKPLREYGRGRLR